MEITVNGELAKLGVARTVSDLLQERNINPDTVVVEVNLDILEKAAYGERSLCDGDTVEILRFVGGG